MKKTILKIKKTLAQIDEYDLNVPTGFRELTMDYIADNYNGAGPDWMPEEARHVLTWLLDIFEPAFLIHDMEFSASDRTEKGFIAANNRLWRNIKKIINYLYPLYNPFCWAEHARWWCKGYETWQACVKFGHSAWMD